VIFLSLGHSGSQLIYKSLDSGCSVPLSLVSSIMSVTLDNIQFYHGPSKPRTPPYFAFDSKRNTSGTPLSARPPEFANDSTPSAIDHCDPRSPVPHPDNITLQKTLQPPNIFDIEMTRMWETVPASEDSHESGASFAQTFGCHLQELSSKGTSETRKLKL
jgi:hypothetical protein